MSKTIDALVTDVRLMLRDSIDIATETDFTDDELKTILGDVLVEVSNVSPYMVKEELTTVANTRDIDISAIDDLLEVELVEYPVDQVPPKYRNFSQRENGKLTVDYAYNLPGSEGIYLYCNKLHSVGTTSSTLNVKEERVLILGAVAKAASQWINRTRELINTAEERLADNTTIASMAARITQAIDDLASARTYINKINVGGRPDQSYMATSAHEIQNAMAYLNETAGYLREGQHYLGISGQIRQYQAYVDRATLEYKVALRTIVKRKVSQSYSTA